MPSTTLVELLEFEHLAAPFSLSRRAMIMGMHASLHLYLQLVVKEGDLSLSRDGDQLTKSVEVLDEMKRAGVRPNVVTYSILIVACEKYCFYA
ncbi:Pentatricopeptide repeat-containing protein [Apostasia shenzhenica]|uniref:Pentatricopeptide repeat-containing protein n=1 Tax=Apostasia shenzhenica TaxID=1088818 RepID=A0A2I0AR06_9ASPA|nr:Pentatricopeptide repeat-containing protein [Apostasia shenzhenica]